MSDMEFEYLAQAESISLEYDRKGSTITDEARLLQGILAGIVSIARMIYNNTAKDEDHE